jgi:hypothetical protein
MELAPLIGILSIPLLIFLVQGYRDWRGKRRNKDGRCYKCGAVMYAAVPVPHYRSDLYFYCGECAIAEERKGLAWALLAGVFGCFALGVAVLKDSSTSFWSTVSYAVGASLIFALIAYAKLKRYSSNTPRTIERRHHAARDIHLVPETERLMASEPNPDTRAALQHVLDLSRTLDRKAKIALADLHRRGNP